MRRKRIILIILGVCLFFSSFLGYKKWHYETANAFYLSHKKGESLYKQQKNLTNNINPDVMEELGIEVTYQARSNLLYSMSREKKGVSYTFYPDAEGGSMIVSLRRKQNNAILCSFKFEKNIKGIHLIEPAENEKEELFYKRQSVKVYRQILKEIYDNWEIQ